MRVQQQSTLNAQTSIVKDDVTSQNQNIGIITDISNLCRATNGLLRFGDANTGQNGENIAGQWVTFVTSGTANSAFSVNHTMGASPIGFIVTSINKGAILYTSGTSFTPSTVNFNCTVSNTTATVFLLR